MRSLGLTMTLTLNFQGQTWNLLYLSQKWSDRHKTKSKGIDWTQGLKCDYGVWPWPWPWPWIFKVKYGICSISVKNGLIATKRKANISIELKASNVTIGYDLGHDLDLEFSRSNTEFAISQSKVIRRSGVRIYKIMTGVTSDVGVLWTRLVLTHWGRDKMATIFQMTYSKAISKPFSSMKVFVYWLMFHWNLFPRVQLTIIHHWFR